MLEFGLLKTNLLELQPATNTSSPKGWTTPVVAKSAFTAPVLNEPPSKNTPELKASSPTFAMTNFMWYVWPHCNIDFTGKETVPPSKFSVANAELPPLKLYFKSFAFVK